MKTILFTLTIIILALTVKPYSIEGVGAGISPQINPYPSPTPSVEKKQDRLPEPTTYALAEIPDSSEWKIISKLKNPHLVAHIYKHESTFGRFDACRSRGEYNGFGWRESVTRLKTEGPVCYSDFSVLVSEVDAWIEDKKSQGMSLAKINCLYVRGLAVEQCETAYKLN